METDTLIIEVHMRDGYLHMSTNSSYGAKGFDTGENGEEMNLAIDDLATELKDLYKWKIKKETK